MSANKITSAMQMLINLNRHGESVFSATVESVNINARSCSVTSISDGTQTEYDTVLLMPQVDDGVLIVPAVGSTVIVQEMPNLQPFIIMYSEISQVLYIAGNALMQMMDGTVTLSQGKMKITLSDGKISIQNDSKNLYTILNNLISHIEALTVPTPAGNSGVPLNMTDFQQDASDLSALMQ